MAAAFHDTVYGRIVTDEKRIFERLCMVIFGSARYSKNVIKNIDALRLCFFDFDIYRCAELPEDYLTELYKTMGRARAKVFGVRENARACIRVIADFESLFRFVYSFKNPSRTLAAMRKYGFSGVEPETVKKLMESIGILDGHEPGCFLESNNIKRNAKNARFSDTYGRRERRLCRA